MRSLAASSIVDGRSRVPAGVFGKGKYATSWLPGKEIEKSWRVLAGYCVITELRCSRGCGEELNNADQLHFKSGRFCDRGCIGDVDDIIDNSTMRQ